MRRAGLARPESLCKAERLRPQTNNNFNEPLERKNDGTGGPPRCELKTPEHMPAAVAQGGWVW